MGGGDLDPRGGGATSVRDQLLGRPDLVARVRAFSAKVEFLAIILSVGACGPTKQAETGVKQAKGMVSPTCEE